ncbi:MAG: RpiB/LacA/LacB family sugar-phosphate isomerase [Coprothermobacterota bacterium]|nr:RpiB/LacA/LacB family sugar-phosphate isomerase [Coprothermobacterota bacterium]
MDQSRPLRVALGSDGGDFLVNEEFKTFLGEMGCQSEDFGAHLHASVNYPGDVLLLAKAVSREEVEFCFAPPRGCIAMNRVPDVWAALCMELFTAEISRVPTDENVLCLSGKTIGPLLAGRTVKSDEKQSLQKRMASQKD